MSIGFAVTKQAIDNALGALAVQGRQFTIQGQIVVNSFSEIQDADLTTLGYSADDIAAARAFMGDVTTLIGVINGTATVATAKNFLDSSKPLTGIQ